MESVSEKYLAKHKSMHIKGPDVTKLENYDVSIIVSCAFSESTYYLVSLLENVSE